MDTGSKQPCAQRFFFEVDRSVARSCREFDAKFRNALAFPRLAGRVIDFVDLKCAHEIRPAVRKRVEASPENDILCDPTRDASASSSSAYRLRTAPADCMDHRDGAVCHPVRGSFRPR